MTSDLHMNPQRERNKRKEISEAACSLSRVRLSRQCNLSPTLIEHVRDVTPSNVAQTFGKIFFNKWRIYGNR